MEVQEIKIEDIVIPEERVRATFSEEQYNELKASIEKHGFYIPILVKKLDNGKYELIDGEHRIQVMKELGKEKIPAVIVEGNEQKATMLNILANTARGSQNPMDVAHALRRAYEAGARVAELAAAIGHSEDWVRLYLTMTELPEKYQQALREGRITPSHVKEAFRLDDDREILSALDSAITLGWTTRVLKYYVDQRKAELEKLGAAGKDGFIEAPPTVEYAKQIVEYADCMTCKRKVNRNDMYMPAICADCRTLLEWIVQQLGDPKEAMQTIYNALNFYFEMQRRGLANVNQQNQNAQQAQQQIPASNSQPANQNVDTTDLTAEDLRLIRVIKALKKEGLL